MTGWATASASPIRTSSRPGSARSASASAPSGRTAARRRTIIRPSAVFQPCNTRASAPEVVAGTAAQLNAAGSGVNCAFASAPRTGIGETIGDTYYLAAGRTFRAQKTREARDAVVGAVQWRPSGTFEMIADGQYSFRRSLEDRNILNFADGLRGIQPLVVGNGINGYSKGALISFRGNSFLEDQLETRNRNEEYLGGGLSWQWRPGRFSLTGDLSYSGSHRIETQKATRMRSSRRVAYTQTYHDDETLPEVQFDGFDIADPALFAATAADAVCPPALCDRPHDRIWAGRADATYGLDGVLREIKVGARYSDHRRRNDNAANADLNTLQPVGGQTPAHLIASANLNCRAPFTTSAFMAGKGTNVTRWATFDNDCLFRTFTGSDDALPYPTETRGPQRHRRARADVRGLCDGQLPGRARRDDRAGQCRPALCRHPHQLDRLPPALYPDRQQRHQRLQHRARSRRHGRQQHHQGRLSLLAAERQSQPRAVADPDGAPGRLSRHCALQHREPGRGNRDQSVGRHWNRQHHLQRDHRKSAPQAAAQLERRSVGRFLLQPGYAAVVRGLL